MNRRLLGSLLLACVLFSACSGTTGAAPAAPAAEASPVPTAFDGARAMAHVQALAGGIGPRVAGSANEQRAADYIRDQFKAYGYDVEEVPFTFSGDRFQPATVTIDGKPLGSAFTLLGSTPGQLTARAASVGLGDAAGVAGRDLTGLIAVADRGTLTFAEKYDNVRRAGAAGLIVVNTEDGDLLGTIYKDGDIPMAGVGRAGRATLNDAIAAGKQVTIEVPPTGKTPSINVIARPAKGAECRVIVGGHHDTVPSAPGAHDNASGAAETLELARTFAADGLDAGLCFATFGAEESGLFGSQEMVKDLASRNALPRAMVNLDMVAVGTQVSLIGTAELVGPALAKAKELGIDAAAVTLGFAFGSDHQPFEKAGVPVLAFATNDLGNFHTPQDIVEAVSVTMLDSNGRLAYAVIAELLQRVAQG